LPIHARTKTLNFAELNDRLEIHPVGTGD